MSLVRTPMLAGLGAALVMLLPRMRRDFEGTGELSTTTAAGMWGCYFVGAAIYGDALRRGRPLARTPRSVAGAVAATGLAMTAAGMSAFGTAGQLTGTRQGPLATGGVYRISRNPQYIGTAVAAMAGAVARRSSIAAGLAGAYAAVCRWWVPVEERTLEHRFGDDYRRFRAATPRWLGLPRRRRGANAAFREEGSPLRGGLFSAVVVDRLFLDGPWSAP